MDKDTIKGYLQYVKTLMLNGEFIKAYKELGIILDNLGTEKNGK